MQHVQCLDVILFPSNAHQCTVTEVVFVVILLANAHRILLRHMGQSLKHKDSVSAASTEHAQCLVVYLLNTHVTAYMLRQQECNLEHKDSIAQQAWSTYNIFLCQLSDTHDMNAATGGVELKTPGQHQCSKHGACTISCCVSVTECLTT